MFVENNMACRKEKAVSLTKNGHFENWLPGRDLRHVGAGWLIPTLSGLYQLS